MHDILLVLVHSIVTVVRLIKPGGLRAVVAESALTRHQILIPNRSRKRAPNLRVSDRIIAGLCTGRVEDWRHCSVGSAYPLLPVSVGSASLSEPSTGFQPPPHRT